MENTANTGNTQQNRPGNASAQTEATKPATAAARTTAQNPAGSASEQAAGVTGQTEAPERTTGPEEATERKRIDPIALAEEKLKQKEARLAEKRNSLTQRKRKARNGQLFVWGAVVEAAYSQGCDADRETIRSWAKQYLTEARHVERSDFGLFRLDKERKKGQEE